MRSALLKLLLLASTLCLLFGVDRLLYARYGNPLWQFDSVLHYEHIPGAQFNWGERYGGKPIRINRHGHHDDDFPVEKPGGELRILVIGDSVVMGHGVPAAETFSNRLETVLDRRLSGNRTYQVINAGVQGYSTFQYLEVLQRAWRFEPDLVLVGFSMNDVTEPYRVRKEHGGQGIDYHGILQDASTWRGFLINQTGYGRLALHLSFGNEVRQAGRETINVREMVEAGPEEEPYFSAWKAALDDLDEMREMAAERGVPLVTLVFPFRFQLGDATAQHPQRILAEQAERSGSALIEFTTILEEHQRRHPQAAEIFLDRSHFSATGHKVVARLLFQELNSLGYLEDQESAIQDPSSPSPANHG